MFPIQRFVTKNLYSRTLAAFAKAKKKGAEEEIKSQEGIDQQTLEFLQQKIKTARGHAVIDKEDYLIHVGLFISRPPIFLSHHEKEMEGLKFRYKYAKKYKLMIPIPKELADFEDKGVPEKASLGTDELPTHEYTNPEGIRSTYCATTKIWSKVDPAIFDPKSIQFASDYRTFLVLKEKKTQKWIFPNAYLPDKVTFANSKIDLFNTVSEKKWQVAFAANIPLCVTKRELTETEKVSAMHKKAIGVKTFYFLAYHEDGKVAFNEELYDDYAWTTRLDLNKYFDKENYDSVIHALSLY